MIANLNLSTATRWGLNCLILLGATIALHAGESIFIPTVIALLFAAMLWPLVLWLRQGLRLPWALACMVIVLGLAVLMLLMTFGVMSLLVIKLVQDLPGPNDVDAQKEVYAKVRDRLAEIMPLDEQYLPKDPDQSRVFQYVQQTLQGPYVGNVLRELSWYGNNLFWEWVLIMFILLFLLVEGPTLTQRVVEIFGPSEAAQAHALHALSDMAQNVRTYLVWRTIVNFGLALLVGLVYQWYGLRQPWTWAFFTAVLCYVPYIGPLAAGVPPVIDAFITQGPELALGLAGFYLVLLTLEGYVIVPVVMGRSMELNATTVMLACLFWERVWGLTGLFLAMPLMAGIKAVCEHLPDGRPWANLMSTRKAALRLAKEELDKAGPEEETQLILPEEVEKIEARRSRREKK